MKEELLSPFTELCVLAERTGAVLSHQKSNQDLSVLKGLLCQVGKIVLMLPLTNGLEITPPKKIQDFPFAKPWFKGVTKHRGLLFPVLDFETLAGGGQVAISQWNRFLFCQEENMQLAFMVEKIYGIESYQLDMLKPFKIDKPFLQAVGKGACRLRNHKVICLDYNKLGAHPNISNLTDSG